MRQTFRVPGLAALLLVPAFYPQHRIDAQQSDVVRGRVVNDSSLAVAGATVSITRGPDRLVQQVVTDANGQYSSRFDPGTGDYLVHVAATGFRAARRRVQREASERELVADFILVPDLSMLATVNVTATRPVRASAVVSPTQTEPGANEAWSNGVNGRVTPGAAGDLLAIAGTIPGVTVTASGPSILGSSASSNLTTLNGIALPGAILPRAARIETRVTGATFDATRGGFAGANIDSRLGPGDRNYQQRNAYFTLDAPQLQLTDAVARSLGLRNTGFRGSIGADGEAIRNVLTYNVALDVARNSNSPSTLLDSDTEAWRRAGVAPDSVLRLLGIAGASGVPVSGADIPSSRIQNGLTLLSRFDDVRDTLRTLTLTTYASMNREGGLGLGPLASPAGAAERSENTFATAFTHSAFIGSGHYVLMQNRLSGSTVARDAGPYTSEPAASVFIRSSSAETTFGSDNDVATISLGGGRLSTNERRWTVEGANELIWMARGSKHRFKTQLWARGDGLEESGNSNEFGQYSYNSLEDFAANRPSSFTRILNLPERSATSYNGAVAFSHQWNKSRWFNLLYGARVEASAFGNAPPRNMLLESSLGVATGVAPTNLHISPRVGFSYTYSRSKSNGSGMQVNSVGRFYRTTMGYVRGGIGEFRDLYNPSMLTSAVAGTGLPGSTISLSCVGAAVPIPDWSSFDGASPSIPSACVGGSGTLADRASSVTLLGKSFDAPRSWRASLGWGSSFKRVITKIDALGSYDLNQAGTIDANFAGTPNFTLASESNRPVFVSPFSIDPSSGAVSATSSRIDSDFGRVAVRESDLRGYGGQLTATLQPDVFGLRSRITFFTSLSYTLQRTLQQYRGFDGGGFGDPRRVEWATGNNDARHAFVFQGGMYIPKVGAITAFSRFQSGLPFTPIVQGDVNGDGRSGDRAFIPDPRSAETSSELRSGMESLLQSTSGNVRDCLSKQFGNPAGRNSCRGPWTQQLNIQWTPRLPITVQGRRVVANVVFDNPLAGIDQLLNGQDGLKGWGTRAAPDPVLLVPRAFNTAGKSFQYDVNPRFGDTRAFRTLSRQPFRITLDFSINFSTPYDIQQLRRAVEPVRSADGWRRRSADSITAYYLRNTSSIHKLLLAESDSLFLDRAQIASLLAADSVFGTKVRAVYAPLGEFLAGQPNGLPGKAALDSANATDKLYWTLFWEEVDVAEPLITPLQKQLLPFIARMMAVNREERKDSRYQFGYPVTVVHTKPRVGSGGSR